MLYQTESPNSARSRGAGAAELDTSCNSSGAERPSRQRRTKAAAACSGPKRSRMIAAISASSPTGCTRHGCSSKRISSLAETSSAEGALAHSATTFAPCNKRCALRNSGCVTIKADTPFEPARPVRPERCNSVSEFDGRSACITRSSPGKSIPRAATSVAIQTRARPSRNACNACVRSCWLSSPDRATT